METAANLDLNAVVLLVAPPDHSRDHLRFLSRAGFHVVAAPDDDGDSLRTLIVDLCPGVVAIEDVSWHRRPVPMIRRIRQSTAARVPIVIYGTDLSPRVIGHVVRAGALWLEVGPGDAWKLEAAIRGILAASRPG